MQKTAPRQGIAGAAEYLAAQGRNGDTMLSHLTAGETIIPQEILDKNPNLRKDLQNAFDYEEVPMDQYVVGSGVMSINPETGLPEFGWLSKTWKSVRKTVKKAGPVIGTVIGAMIGGPIGASIGAGIGTKTSAMPKEDILRNMALAYGATNIAMGAGVGNAASSAKTAASSAGGWSNPFAAAYEGVGAFFNGTNWTPMGVGETSGIGGFFQDIGGGFSRSMGFGGTGTLVDAGLTGAEAQKVSALMQNGVDAVTAAQQIGITDPTILRTLGTNTFGPGVLNAGGTAYASLNPLEQWAVQTGFDVATGIAQEQGGFGDGSERAQAYMGRSLTSGGAIPMQNIQGSNVGIAGMQPMGNNINARSFQQGINAPTNTTITDTRAGNTAMLPMVSGQQAPTQQAPTYESAIARTSQGNEMLDLLAGTLARRQLPESPGLASLTTPFPTFEQPTYAAANGGFIGSDRGMFMGGGYVQGPGGEKDDMVNAKLSNNEFVMTADAVRGAGNGSIKQGANKMYEMMNNFERRA